jgi:hypothetical protein
MESIIKFLEKNIIILIILLVIASGLIYLFYIKFYFIEKIAPVVSMLYGI